MKMYWSTRLAAAALVCLLHLGPSPAGAYYPPLQATGSGSGSTVSFSVSFPWGGGISASGTYGPGITVSNFTQDKGVMAWIVQDGSTFSVGSCTFDPSLNTFQIDEQGPFSMVSHFQVMDGVVAYSIIDSSGNAGCRCATYDPAMGAWQQAGIAAVPGSSTWAVLCKDGLVVYRSFNNGCDAISARIYEPQWGQWSNSFYTVICSGNVPEWTYLFISNATIYYGDTFGNYLAGWNLGGWGSNPTVPFAYFVAQPDFGKAPLLVWFTDMSIAGTSWNWDFKDSTTSTSRSPYHTFTSTGIYQVSQQINGPSTYSRPVTVVKPYTFENKSLPGILYLLLLAD